MSGRDDYHYRRPERSPSTGFRYALPSSLWRSLPLLVAGASLGDKGRDLAVHDPGQPKQFQLATDEKQAANAKSRSCAIRRASSRARCARCGVLCRRGCSTEFCARSMACLHKRGRTLEVRIVATNSFAKSASLPNCGHSIHLHILPTWPVSGQAASAAPRG